jgi:chromosome segregation ATPase
MRRPAYVCATCSEHFTRRYSATRHNLTIHEGIGKQDGLRSEINVLEGKRKNSTNHLFNLERMINEFEETLAQKRGEMAYLNRECRKLRQRIIDYNTHNSHPITQKSDTNSHSTQIIPYSKE